MTMTAIISMMESVFIQLHFHHPTTTATMGRIFQGFVVIAVAVVSALMYSYQEMTAKTAESIAQLQLDEMEEASAPLSPQEQQEAFQKLPHVVKTYLQKAIPSMNSDNIASVKRVKSLSLQQEGTIRINGKHSHWVPFTASQFFSSSLTNIGFVWDALVFMAEPIPTFVSKDVHLDLAFFVQDTYVKGKGLLEARLLGVVPVAHFEDSPDINAGELMRWLAESFLFPTVFLPSLKNDGILTWSEGMGEHASQKARLSVTDPQSNQTKASVTVTFDKETGLPLSVLGLRAKAITDKHGIGGVSYTKWQGSFQNYTEVEGMLIPTTFHAGWWKGEKKLELYFKGENKDFHYEYY